MNKQEDHDKIVILESRFNGLLGFGRVVITVCVTSTLATIGMLWHFGGWLYDNSNSLKAGIREFLRVKGGGQ